MFDSRTASSASLAYLGDAVLELRVRERLVAMGYTSSKSLNQHALEYVRAGAQARAMERLLPHLTDEEMAVFRRGRNTGHGQHPKGATVGEYRNATGMEALFGYLHMMKNEARIKELFALAYPVRQEELQTP